MGRSKKRKGPGRPALSKDVKRALLQVRVAPVTLKAIKSEAARRGINAGRVVDSWNPAITGILPPTP